jgi:outer membrane protein assembly factor BamE (lipoprotein component of BamABCDE complex)
MRRTFTLALVVLAVVALVAAGCTTVDRAAMKRSLYVDQHPDLPEMMAEAILSGQIMVGMSDEMVQTAWGKPVRVESVQADDAAARWIYGNYFVGGNITSLYFDARGTLVRYEVNYQQAHASNSGTVSPTGKEVPVGTLSGSETLLSKGSQQP